MCIVNKSYAFRNKPFFLDPRAAKRIALAQRAVFEHDPMTGNVVRTTSRRRIAAQCKAHIARRLRAPHQPGNLPIRRHLATRHLAHDVENLFSKRSHAR